MLWSNAQLDDGTGRFVHEDPSVLRDANITLPISIDGAPPIDEAVQLTIADMPNALRLLENS